MTRSVNFPLLLLLASALFLSSLLVAGKPSDDLKPIRREVYEGGKIFDISHRYTPEMPAWESTQGMVNFLRLAASMKNGSFANVSEMKLSVHSGTHIDAPGHFIDKYYDAGFDSDSLDLRVLNGPALLVDVPRNKNITAEVMEALNIPKGVRRVLFRTVNTDKRLMFKKEFDSSFAGFMTDGAKWLVENTDIKLVAEVMESLNIPKGVRRVLFRTENTDKRLVFKKEFDSSYAGFVTDGAKWLVENTNIKLVGLDYLSFAAYEESPATHNVILAGRDIIPVEGLKLDDVKVGMYMLHCLPLRLVRAEGAPTRCILIE